MGRTNTTRRGALPHPSVRSDDATLTQYAGLLPVLLFANESLQLPKRLRAITGPAGRRKIHPVHTVLMAFVAGALAGATRMAHLEWLRDDAVLLKYLRFAHWPVRKVFSAALESVTDTSAAALEELVARVGHELMGSDVASAVIDIDNTALVDHGAREGSRFGYCGKGRRRRRHFPLVASMAATRAVFMTKYRDGSSMTGEEISEFLVATVERARAWLGEACTLSIRGDAGFVSRKVLNTMTELKVRYTMAHPMSAALKLMLATSTFAASTEVGAVDDEDIEFATLDGKLLRLPPGHRVVIVRRRVHDPAAPPMGKRVKSSLGWRYQAIVTNQLHWSAPDVWRFYNDRADCERVFRTGKQGLGLGNFVGRSFTANRAAFLLRLLAFNLDLRFASAARQEVNEHPPRSGELRPPKNAGLLWRQYYFYRSPGRLLRERCRWVLRTSPSRLLRGAWRLYGEVGRRRVGLETSEVAA